MRHLNRSSCMDEFVHIYENSLYLDICNKLIEIYENTISLGKHENIKNNYKPNFTQFNLTENCKINDEVNSIHNHVIKKTLEYRNKYYEYMDSRVFPESHAFEQFRIKKYEPNGEDMFDTHVDVQDYSSARRYLSFFWYLNDVDIGGNTVFNDVVISPRSGKLVVFPPLWLFPHRGEPPISGPKYLLSTYLHYK